MNCTRELDLLQVNLDDLYERDLEDLLEVNVDDFLADLEDL